MDDDTPTLDSLGRMLGDPAGDGVAGVERPGEQRSALAEIGPGGFSIGEFELARRLGVMSATSVAEAEPTLSDDGALTTRSGQRGRPVSVISYAAQYVSGKPYEGPVLTLLKEYPPGARRLGWSELAIAKELQGGLPAAADKWRVASMDPVPGLPAAPVLGYFTSVPTDEARRIAELSGGDASQESLWVVTKWEGLAPLQQVLGRIKNPRPPSEAAEGVLGRWLGVGRSDGDAPWRRRWARGVVRGALGCLAACHGKGVAHGSLCTQAVFVSEGPSERGDGRPIVRLSNLGLAPLSSAADVRAGTAQDSRGMAAVVLEVALSSLSLDGAGDRTGPEAVSRLLFDALSGDADALRDYMLEEPEWEPVCAWLGEGGGAGWALLGGLLGGERGVGELAGDAEEWLANE